MITLAPRDTNSRVQASPIPEVPPVTITVLFSMDMMAVSPVAVAFHYCDPGLDGAFCHVVKVIDRIVSQLPACT